MALAITLGGMPFDRSAARAQEVKPAPFDPAWSVSIVFGGVFGWTPEGGEPIGGFPTGATFATAPGFPSRANPSWFFGDGARLFNEVQSQFAVLFDEHFPRIEPLDDLLRSAAAGRRGRGVGIRIARRITPRVGVEFELDRGGGSLRPDRAVDEAVEAARAGFEAAFSGLLATVPASQIFVTATTERQAAGSGRTALAASVTIALRRTPRVESYASAGVASFRAGGSASEVRLRGNYRFRLLGSVPIDETDEIAIRFTDRDRAVAGLIGGGLTFNPAPRHGLRVEARVSLSGGGITTAVASSPSRTASSSGVALPSQTNPSLQFSSLTNIPSSLGGGPPLVTTFTGRGLEVGVHISAGYLFRF